MKIASNPVLSDSAHGPDLPPSWRTLYELTKLDDQVLLARIEDHTINCEMERRDVEVIAASVAKPEVTKAEWPKSLPETDELIEAETVEVTPPTGPQSSEAEGEDAEIAEPEVIEDNIMHSLGRMNAHAKMFKNTLEFPPLTVRRKKGSILPSSG
jgi:hypothetical protein